MNFLLWILIGLINGVAIVAFAKLFQLPFFITIMVLIPLDVVAMTIYSFYFSFRSSVKPLPIPRQKFNDRVDELNRRGEELAGMGFEKTDLFYMPILPDTVVACFSHRDEPLYICIYHMGVRVAADVISLYKNDVSLTTGMVVDGGNLPIGETSMLQIFPDAPYHVMVERHHEAVEFLKTRGYEPQRLSPEQFREEFIKSYREVFKRVTGHSFWPVKLVFWAISQRGNIYTKSIARQFADGLIKIS